MTIEQEVEALKAVPILQNVDKGKLRLLAFISERNTFHKGESLCEQGEMGDSAFIILSGKADVCVDSGGHQARVAELGENDIVGEISILCDVPRTASVVASEEVQTLTISKDQFFKLLMEFPEIAFEIMRVLARRLERTTREFAEFRSTAPGVQGG